MDSIADETGRLLSGLADSNSSKRFSFIEEISDDKPDEYETHRQRKKKSGKNIETLEKSFEALNVKKFEREIVVDPLFKKTCADFDEAGARGLLLNNLSLDLDGRIVFDASAANFDLKTPKIDNEIEESKVEIEDLLRLKDKYLQALSSINDFELCPTFKNYNSDKPMANIIIPDANSNDQGIDDFGMEIDMGLDSDEATSEIEGNMMEGENVFEAPASTEQDTVSSGKFMMALSESGTNMFSYFDNAEIKNWSGPEHWKVKVTKSGIATKSQPRERKTKQSSIDFMAVEPIDPNTLFMKSNTAITFTQNALQERSTNDNRLPEDLHYSAKDLMSLFLKPHWTAVKSSTGPIHIQRSHQGEPNQAYANPIPQESKQEPTVELSQETDEFDDNDFEVPEFEAPEIPSTDFGNMLIAEPRITKVLKMNYTKVAKRVDVKLLKENLWNELSQVKSKPQKFSQTVSGLSNDYSPEKLKDISVPFCFICLLHLANEKNLKIESNGGDLVVSKE